LDKDLRPLEDLGVARRVVEGAKLASLEQSEMRLLDKELSGADRVNKRIRCVAAVYGGCVRPRRRVILPLEVVVPLLVGVEEELIALGALPTDWIFEKARSPMQ